MGILDIIQCGLSLAALRWGSATRSQTGPPKGPRRLVLRGVGDGEAAPAASLAPPIGVATAWPWPPHTQPRRRNRWTQRALASPAVTRVRVAWWAHVEFQGFFKIKSNICNLRTDYA